jgi:4-hydroxybenzoate polyprenyltransferase
MSVVQESTHSGGGPAPLPGGRARLRAVLTLVRPPEWAKNLFVLAPLLFSKQLFESSADVLAAVGVFVAFCAISSAGYVVNDLHDIELDRQHSVKRHRPLPSGAVSVRFARVLAPALTVAGLVVAAAVGLEALAATVAYGLLTASYTFVFKSIVILDVMAIAACFLARLLGGAAAIDTELSSWIIVCTGTLALFLGFTKRRQEAVHELAAGSSSRPVLEHYSLPFLDQMVSMVTAATVIGYIIYATESPVVGNRMLWTVPFVLYGIFRYLYLIYDRDDPRRSASLLARDPGLIVAVVLWALVAGVLLGTEQ